MFYYQHACTFQIIDDMIFAIGGFNGVSTIFNVECFDDNKNEWYEATDMNSNRSALGACVVYDLPNINDYIHKNRKGLIEEKRQRMLSLRNMEMMRTRFDGRQVFPQLIQGRINADEEEETEDDF